MQGSVRKKGATWSYRVEFGVVDGKRNQIERSGFRTKGDATKAMNEVIYNYNMTGDFVLYVSKYKEEWQMDREDLRDNIALSYVYNVDCPEFSEFGSIGFAQRFGGIVRTA